MNQVDLNHQPQANSVESVSMLAELTESHFTLYELCG